MGLRWTFFSRESLQLIGSDDLIGENKRLNMMAIHLEWIALKSHLCI